MFLNNSVLTVMLTSDLTKTKNHEESISAFISLTILTGLDFDIAHFGAT